MFWQNFCLTGGKADGQRARNRRNSIGKLGVRVSSALGDVRQNAAQKTEKARNSGKIESVHAGSKSQCNFGLIRFQ